MTILSVERKRFEKDIGKLDEKMQEKIALFGTPVEDLTNEKIDIEIFPNRPDLLAYENYKIDFLAYLGRKKGLREIKLNKPLKDFEVKIDKSVEGVRPYTVCAIVKNLKLNDEKIKELIDIQEKLHMTLGRKRKKAAIGIYPLEKIKLPIKFIALEPEKIKFQPLEFPREINGRQILSQHPTGREYGNLLEGFAKYPVFIDANNEVLSMPPIINSHKTGKIEDKTKEVFIECSGFDLNTLNKIMNIIVSAMAEMGGDVYQMTLSYNGKKIITPDLTPDKMKFSLDKCNKLLGLNLKENDVKNLLEKMGYKYDKGFAYVPAWRIDVLHEVDLFEDVAIAYGYDNFVPEIPQISTIGEIDANQIINKKIANILSGLGLIETSSYHLTTKEYQIDKTGMEDRGIIEVESSKTEYNLLRKDLSHYMLKILSENVDVEYPHEIFQIGRVFSEDKSIREKDNLSIAIAPGNFTKLRQNMEYLGKMLGIKFEFESSKNSGNYFIDGRVASVKVNGKEIGLIGEVHPRILKNFKIKMPVALLEINLEEIYPK